jgi:hypothetical protein
MVIRAHHSEQLQAFVHDSGRRVQHLAVRYTQRLT